LTNQNENCIISSLLFENEVNLHFHISFIEFGLKIYSNLKLKSLKFPVNRVFPVNSSISDHATVQAFSIPWVIQILHFLRCLLKDNALFMIVLFNLFNISTIFRRKHKRKAILCENNKCKKFDYL
jgi:hypothetical protein